MNYLKSIADKLKAAYDVVTGKSAREAEKLRKEALELVEKSKELSELMRDHMALTKFKARKASEYFNERAAREPEQAEEYRRIAQLAATVDTSKLRGVVSAYTSNEADVKEWHLISDRYSSELNQYAGKKIGEFIAEDPARWERIKKQAPDKVADLKP